MMSQNTNTDFSALLNVDDAKELLQHLIKLENEIKEVDDPIKTHTQNYFENLIQQGQQLYRFEQHNKKQGTDTEYSEQLATDWLITLFDTLFASQKVKLVRGNDEPEYIPACDTNPARIEFANGFFASALHELSHWSIAGEKRRQLADFGYWYAPDGRNATQQQAFECLEIKPQALECLFTLACKRPFRVSQDNLFADFDTSASTFAKDVYQQASLYIATPQSLPRDAKTLLRALLTVYAT
jgi:hypothetical protein